VKKPSRGVYRLVIDAAIFHRARTAIPSGLFVWPGVALPSPAIVGYPWVGICLSLQRHEGFLRIGNQDGEETAAWARRTHAHDLILG
jgi:hypothetical protein